MADVKSYEAQLGKQNKVLEGYSKDLPGNIKKEVYKAWSPSMKEASNVVGKQLKDLLPNFFNIPYMMGGTSEADVGPQAKLQQMGTGLGELGGNLDSASRYADYMGASAKEAYSMALQAMQTGNTNAADYWTRLFQMYQVKSQEAENTKNRAAQASLAKQQGTDWDALMKMIQDQQNKNATTAPNTMQAIPFESTAGQKITSQYGQPFGGGGGGMDNPVPSAYDTYTGKVGSNLGKLFGDIFGLVK